MIHSPEISRMATEPSHTEYVTFRVAEQWMGVPVNAVQEVLMAQRIARVPLTGAAMAGFQNLRGQVVTALDLRIILELPPRSPEQEVMNVVLSHADELFAVMVDEVGDVVSVASNAIEPTPTTLGCRWNEVCSGLVQRDSALLLIVNVNALLCLEHSPT